MKMLVNTSKNFVLLIIKAKDIVESEAFIVCYSKFKCDLVEVVNTYENMFQEPEGFPPKIGIQNEIHLQQDAPLIKHWHAQNANFGECRNQEENS